MIKSKNKKIVLIASILGVLAISMVGGAFAKYISSVDGSGSLQVAKWDITQSVTSLSNQTYTAATLSSNKIAPGTEGSFVINFDAGDTETGVDYVITFSDITNVPANMYFKVDGNEYATLAQVATAISGHFDANAATKSFSKTIEWKWDYETTTSKDGLRTTLAANDAQDTTDGEAANTMSFNVNVTATQSPLVENV